MYVYIYIYIHIYIYTYIYIYHQYGIPLVSCNSLIPPHPAPKTSTGSWPGSNFAMAEDAWEEGDRGLFTWRYPCFSSI